MIVARIAQDKFNELAAKLQEQEGLELTGSSGKLQKNGVTAEYAYDGTRLTIDVVGHPFLVSKGYCEGKLREALAEHGCVAE